MTATQIKVIAIIAMTLDHIAYTFLPAGTVLHYILHLIGKTTAPIMCFFLAEGFRHTHDKKKYFFRLLLFAVISQPVYYIKRQTKNRSHIVRTVIFYTVVTQAEPYASANSAISALP